MKWGKGVLCFFHSFDVMFYFVRNYSCQLGCVGWTQWKWHVFGITGHEVLTKSDAREMRPLLEVPFGSFWMLPGRVIIRYVIDVLCHFVNLHIGYVTMFCGKWWNLTSFGWPQIFFRCPKSFCVGNVWPYHDIDNTYYHFEAYSKTDFNTSPHSAGWPLFPPNEFTTTMGSMIGARATTTSADCRTSSENSRPGVVRVRTVFVFQAVKNQQGIKPWRDSIGLD